MAVRLSDAWLDELRMRCSLEEIVSEYVPLKQKGRRFWGCCPFHNEKTPSFSVDSEAQLFYCFGCHKGGTVIHFIMDMEHMEFMDAVRYLADRAHMEMPQEDAAGRPSYRSEDREKLYDANREAARFYHAQLWKPEGAEVLNYFYKRGLNDSDIRRFGLGASPHRATALMEYLTEKGFTEKTMADAGLLAVSDDRKRDMFRERAMFPIINAQGRVVGFGGRAMGDGKPKYLNTADTPVFNKRQGLYALNWAKKERDEKRLVLVEGYMDTLSLRRNGILGVVATLGTALTDEQARLMRRYAPEVWISYDGDPPGQKAALRALDILENQGLPARVIDYPSGMDPDDYVKAYGKAGFDSLKRFTAAEYRMLRARDGLDLSRQEDLTAYTMACCKIIGRLKNPVEMENYVRKLVNETGYDREVILEQIRVRPAQERQPVRRAFRREVPQEITVTKAEQIVLTLLAKRLIPTDVVEPQDFSGALQRGWVEALKSGKKLTTLIEEIDDANTRDAAMRAFNYEPLPQEADEMLRLAQNALQDIRRERLEARINEIQQQINQADPERKRILYEQMEAIGRELEG